MGNGILKRKNSLKKQMIRPLQQYCQELEKQLQLVLSDPNSVLGTVLPQLRDQQAQNQRLTGLVAALIKKAGGSIAIEKEAMTIFEGKRIQIQIDVPTATRELLNQGKAEKTEEELFQEATEYVFTYNIVELPPPQAETTGSAESAPKLALPDPEEVESFHQNEASAMAEAIVIPPLGPVLVPES